MSLVGWPLGALLGGGVLWLVVESRGNSWWGAMFRSPDGADAQPTYRQWRRWWNAIASQRGWSPSSRPDGPLRGVFQFLDMQVVQRNLGDGVRGVADVTVAGLPEGVTLAVRGPGDGRALALGVPDFDERLVVRGPRDVLWTWLDADVRACLLAYADGELSVAHGVAHVVLRWQGSEAIRGEDLGRLTAALSKLSATGPERAARLLHTMAHDPYEAARQGAAEVLQDLAEADPRSRALVRASLTRTPSLLGMRVAVALGDGPQVLEVLGDHRAPEDARLAAAEALEAGDVDPGQLAWVVREALRGALGASVPLALATARLLARPDLGELARDVARWVVPPEVSADPGPAWTREPEGRLALLRAALVHRAAVHPDTPLRTLRGVDFRTERPMLDALWDHGDAACLVAVVGERALPAPFRAEVVAHWTSRPGRPTPAALAVMRAALQLTGVVDEPVLRRALEGAARRGMSPLVEDLASLVNTWLTPGEAWRPGPPTVNALVNALVAHREVVDDGALARACRVAEAPQAVTILTHLAVHGTWSTVTDLAALTHDHREEVQRAATAALEAVQVRTGKAVRGGVSLAEQLGGEVSLSKTVGGEVDVVEEENG